jgi:cell division protein FtsB
MTDGRVRNSLSLVRILLILMGVLVLYLVVSFVRQAAISQKSQEELAELEQAITAAEEKRAGLREDLVYAQSEAAVEEWARENNWAKPDEVSVVVVAPPASASRGVEGSSEGAGGPDSPRDAWWELFFGTR